jgi:hypothetical protein
MTDDGRILDPRSRWLIAAATVVLTLVAAVAAMVCVFLAIGIGCEDVDCDDHVNTLLLLSLLAAPGAVLLGGVVAGVTARWRWCLLGAAAAAAMIAADVAFG